AGGSGPAADFLHRMARVRPPLPRPGRKEYATSSNMTIPPVLPVAADESSASAAAPSARVAARPAGAVPPGRRHPSPPGPLAAILAASGSLRELQRMPQSDRRGGRVSALFDLTGQVAVVTGGASGIGRA